jgi:hypothetical protein
MRGWMSTAQAAAALGVSPNARPPAPWHRAAPGVTDQPGLLDQDRRPPTPPRAPPRGHGPSPVGGHDAPRPPPEHHRILPDSPLIAPKDQS